MNESLTFNRIEQRRSNVMTTDTIQPICRKHNIKIGCYDGFRVCPRVIAVKKYRVIYVQKPFLFSLENR